MCVYEGLHQESALEGVILDKDAISRGTTQHLSSPGTLQFPSSVGGCWLQITGSSLPACVLGKQSTGLFQIQVGDVTLP